MAGEQDSLRAQLGPPLPTRQVGEVDPPLFSLLVRMTFVAKTVNPIGLGEITFDVGPIVLESDFISDLKKRG